MRSSRLLLVLLVGLFALGAGGCRVYLVPAGETGPAPENVEETDAPEDTDTVTTGEETEDDVEPAVRDREDEDEADRTPPPEPRERPDREDGEDEESPEREPAASDDPDDDDDTETSRDRAERETLDDTNRVPPQPRERPGRDSEGDEAAEDDSEADAADPDPEAEQDDDAPEATEDEDELGQREARREGRRRARRRARGVRVPPGHYPPEGQCRIWYPGEPPGQQPPAAPCDALAEQEFDSGAFILYGGVAWDGDYDWEAVEMEHPGAVPRPVLLLIRSVGDGGR